MMNDVEPGFLSQLDAVFAQLNPQAVEEFYATYQQWRLQQRIIELRQRIDAVREQQVDNQQRLRETQPAAIALAALARLQSNGVSDIALLDAMLERGESWLDQTMQRLDYFEQFDDFISDDYTKWCQGALEGAFDWIDSLRENTEYDAPTQLEAPPVEVSSNSEDAGEVEALLLQRLATEDEQDDLPWQEATTLKRTAINLPPQETVTTESEGQEPPAPEEDVAQQDMETQAHETERPESPTSGPFIVEAGADVEEGGDPCGRLHTPGEPESAVEPTPGEPESAVEPTPGEPESAVEPTPISEPDQPTFIEFAPIEEPAPGEDELHTGDEQPALIESSPGEEPSLTESEFYTGDEQPALVEFAAPSELSEAEETNDRASEQATLTKIAIPENIPVTEDTNQSETNEPVEKGNSASEEVTREEQQVIPAGEPITTARNTPPKRGLIRHLIGILTGK